MVARDTGEIVFDTKSGISVEEQQDIVRQIEHATRSEGGAEAAFRRIHAGKKGYVFPLLVNVAALFLVLLGALLFFVFRNMPETRHLNAAGTLNSAEGKLIQEIRRQSAVQVGEKEMEIAGVSEKIAGLVEERENISAQIKMQPAREAELRPKIDALDAQLDGLRQTLEQLQVERRQLVVISRSQEAEVFSRRASGEASEAAMEELRNLNTEDERYAFFERQVDNYYAQIEILVREGKIDSAQQELANLRAFISNPAFQNIKMVQTQRNLNFAATGALTQVIELVSGDAFIKAEKEWLAERNDRDRMIASLKWQNDKLEQEVAFLQPDVQYEELRKRDEQIAALQGTVNERQQTIAKRENTIAVQEAQLLELRTTWMRLEETVAQRDAQITGLRSQIASLTQTLTDRDRSIREHLAEIENQRATIAERDAAITAMREQSARDHQTIAEREGTIAELRTESANQRQTIAERDRTISQNRTQITIQQQQINERDRTLAELRTQSGNQQQTLTELEQVIEDLRGQTTGGYQAVTERERQIAGLRSQIAGKEQVIAERDASIAELTSRNGAITQTIAERDRTINQLRTQIKNQQQTIAERDKSIQLLLGEMNNSGGSSAGGDSSAPAPAGSTSSASSPAATPAASPAAATAPAPPDSPEASTGDTASKIGADSGGA